MEKIKPEIETQQENQIKNSINIALRVGFIALLFIMSFLFIQPFITPIVWGIIIAVAVYPLHKKLSKLLKNKEKLSATILVAIGILIIIIPSIMFTSSTVDTLKTLAEQFSNGTISIPSPNQQIKDFPIIGTKLFDLWELASQNLSNLYLKFEDQLKSFAPTLLSSAGSLVTTVFIFIISIFISGTLLVHANSGKKTAKGVFKTLAGPAGEQFSDLASATIRSVVQGVLGTAIIQAFTLSLGLYFIDFPGAGIVAIIILFFAIAQLPLILVTIPVIFYVFSYTGTTTAILFTIWTFIWSISDNILKPILMGRGVDIPMLVILLGAIGGMMSAGIIGLFIGAVFLALSYKILMAIISSNTEVN